MYDNFNISFRNVRNQFLKDRVSDINYFKEMLIPTHLNIGNYFIGITAGLIYHFQKKSKEVYKKTFVSLKNPLYT